MAQRKPQGYYCKIFGERKSNESFSEKGHAAHICKACSQLSLQQPEPATWRIHVEYSNGEIQDTVYKRHT